MSKITKGFYFGFDGAGAPVSVSRFENEGEKQEARSFVRRGGRSVKQFANGDPKVREMLIQMGLPRTPADDVFTPEPQPVAWEILS